MANFPSVVVGFFEVYESFVITHRGFDGSGEVDNNWQVVGAQGFESGPVSGW